MRLDTLRSALSGFSIGASRAGRDLTEDDELDGRAQAWSSSAATRSRSSKRPAAPISPRKRRASARFAGLPAAAEVGRRDPRDRARARSRRCRPRRATRGGHEGRHAAAQGRGRRQPRPPVVIEELASSQRNLRAAGAGSKRHEGDRAAPALLAAVALAALRGSPPARARRRAGPVVVVPITGRSTTGWRISSSAPSPRRISEHAARDRPRRQHPRRSGRRGDRDSRRALRREVPVDRLRLAARVFGRRADLARRRRAS